MDFNLSFAKWLEIEMEVRGISQDALARKVGRAPADIRNLLSGNLGPDRHLCSSIAGALNINPVLVFRKAGFVPSSDRKNPRGTDELIDLYSNANEAAREDILAYARIKSEQK